MADLAEIRALVADATEQWHWPTIGQDFDVTAYLTTMDPPPELVVSVRAIAWRGDRVFVFESEGATHALPGGRREPGESPDAALVREIREETGCAIVGTPRRLGLLHLHNLSPRRHDPRYTYPYPDTLQWVFRVEVTGDALPSDDPFVDNGRFVSVEEAQRSVRSAVERLFLDAALA
ncbi:MAG TPA: NUDIX hydrolase [Candidatus Saccharimonadales bacterium]|nr:NUDIX hydrolase [Candidatus Saccharimonadales bacterium]